MDRCSVDFHQVEPPWVRSTDTTGCCDVDLNDDACETGTLQEPRGCIIVFLHAPWWLELVIQQVRGGRCPHFLLVFQVMFRWSCITTPSVLVPGSCPSIISRRTMMPQCRKDTLVSSIWLVILQDGGGASQPGWKQVGGEFL